MHSTFFWRGPSYTNAEGRLNYNSFTLNGVVYRLGDAVSLFPESESNLPFLGRIHAAFVDEHAGQGDPHCIEIKWFERRTNLEPDTKGIEESEREVFELEDLDVNPIGCISGKCIIVRTHSYDDAWQQMKGSTGDWFFCRGYFSQISNAFRAYTPSELAIIDDTTSDNDDVSKRLASVRQAPLRQQKKASGRICAECSATSTPQWREGPTGPKTLCNACGVRYVRAQQKNKRGGPKQPAAASGPRAASSSGTAAVPSRNVRPKTEPGEWEPRSILTSSSSGGLPQVPLPAQYEASGAPLRHEAAGVTLLGHDHAAMPLVSVGASVSGGRRPPRQAALAAAARTAEFARSEEHLGDDAQEGAGAGPYDQPPHGQPRSTPSFGADGADVLQHPTGLDARARQQNRPYTEASQPPPPLPPPHHAVAAPFGGLGPAAMRCQDSESPSTSSGGAGTAPAGQGALLHCNYSLNDSTEQGTLRQSGAGHYPQQHRDSAVGRHAGGQTHSNGASAAGAVAGLYIASTQGSSLTSNGFLPEHGSSNLNPLFETSRQHRSSGGAAGVSQASVAGSDTIPNSTLGHLAAGRQQLGYTSGGAVAAHGGMPVTSGATAVPLPGSLRLAEKHQGAPGRSGQ